MSCRACLLLSHICVLCGKQLAALMLPYETCFDFKYKDKDLDCIDKTTTVVQADYWCTLWDYFY